MSDSEYSTPRVNEEALLLKVVLDHADNVEALLAAEIDRREALEQEMIKAKEAAESANEAKSLFLAKVNHDLRNPLNAMLGVVQLLERTPGMPESAFPWLDMLSRAGDQLNRLIEDLLDISRIEAGKVEVEHTIFSLAEVIEAVAEVNRPLAAERGLELRLTPPTEGLPSMITGDPKRLQRILNNLLGNAVKFTSRGWVELSIEMVADEADRDSESNDATIRFMVSDSGSGIPPHQIAKLFAAFEQGESSEKGKGLGLGLTISSELVGLMGGHIEVESREGVGSRFWFDLAFPRSPNPAETSESVAESPPAPAPLPAAAKQRSDRANEAPAPHPAPDDSACVLAVDDDPAALELLSRQLQEAGLRTLLATDGLSALGIARGMRPDLILLDVQMSGWSGFETCRRLKRNPIARDIPVIFLSGNTDLDSRLEGFRAGGVDYIGKPFAAQEVLARVTVHLASRPCQQADRGRLGLGGDSGKFEDPDSPSLALALKARDLMRERLADPPYLTALARLVGTNQTTLNHAFQRHFGMTVFEYLREERLALAKRMLREGDQAVKVIALEVGYANSRDFSRAFKARLGITPEQYRGGSAE